MNNYNLNGREESVEFASSFSVLMRNVYVWMTLGLIVTACTALIVYRNENLLFAIASNPVLFWGLMIAEFVMVIVLSAKIMSMSFQTAMLLFVLYALLNGLTLSLLFAVYTQESISQTFFITAGTFAGMSLFGFFTKKDLSTMGRALIMALIGLIIATLVNMFMQNSGLTVIINYAGVLIFVGLTAYDTQKIKTILQSCSQAGVTEQTGKIALLGSLTLYLDFINLFLYLLRFFGRKK